MQIAIRSSGMQIPQRVREGVKLRLRFALSRFGEHISRVTTRFWTTSTKTGHKRCLIEVELKLPKIVKAETTDADVLAAVERAVNRLTRSIVRELTMNETVRASTAAVDSKPTVKVPKASRHGSKETKRISREDNRTAQSRRIR
jgi:ribosomal subunit interface protein